MTLTTHSYKGFTIMRCLAGGWHINFNGVRVDHGTTVAGAKRTIDKLPRVA